MTVKEIVKKYLEDNGYDGLYGSGCGCEISDLMPCNEYVIECQAGYKVKPTKDNYEEYNESDDPDWIIVPNR